MIKLTDSIKPDMNFVPKR